MSVTNGGEDAGSPSKTSQKHVLVVALGGSAGSIPSFREFFRNVPSDSGIAYVVILHLSPEHESHLAEVLQSSCELPVLQVREEVEVLPDHVYAIPPNKYLAMSDGKLVLSDPKDFEERRAPIDIFFRTLAVTHESQAVCVVLSGSGADGSVGLRRIKENNGLVIAQDPTEATFAEMPNNSIATGLVDFVLPVAKIPARIFAYRDQLRAVRIPLSLERESSTTDDEKTLLAIFTLLRMRTGHDFTNYKRATVLRRIERRMVLRELTTLSEYLQFITTNEDEPQALFRELLISVTNFFRDPEVWKTVAEKVVPHLLDGKTAADHVRVWVAGCATGEEAYSIAMLLAEHASSMESIPEIQIFATDLDEDAIARARSGCYNEAEVADVPPERLRRYFVKEPDDYRIRREIRDMVLFANHNLVKDPPFSHLNFILCRNVLIYLNRTAQQRALEVMHFALEQDGFLLLGTAESVEASAELFSLVDKEAHLFRSRSAHRIVNVPIPERGTLEHRGGRPSIDEHRQFERAKERITPIDLHQRLLEAYAAPSVIVDEQFNLVHLSEYAGRYLKFAGGEASVNVLQLVCPELRIALRSSLYQAAENRSSVAARGLTVNTGDGTEKIDIIVRPSLREGESVRGYFLILFERARDEIGAAVNEAAAVEPAAQGLEDEMVRLKDQMRMTIAQYEVQAEEGRASNEELQAMNEELRSTAEELETSQEELQSVNEELQTVNQELKVKIEEITQASDDLLNLMAATEIGTIFVDRKLRIKLFTPKTSELFNLLPTDVGRSLLDITNKLSLENLAGDVALVLEKLQKIEREVGSANEFCYLMRIIPYRTAEDHVDGVILTFIDITERKRDEEELRQNQKEFERRSNERTRELEELSSARQQLLQRLVKATEEERQRISRELHDEMGQHITALKVGLESLPPDEAVMNMKTMVTTLDGTIDRLIIELRPPALDELGLAGAVSSLVDQFAAASGVRVDVHSTGLDEARLPEAVESTVYRVLQEALTNIWKHAQAKTVSVIIERQDSWLRLIVEDDGLGFDVEKATIGKDARGHLGLVGIRERLALVGGTMNMESSEGRGTTMYIRVPAKGVEQ